jgi:hypothetical protein
MIALIPSNLIEQLIELSDMSAYLQFFALNKVWLFLSIFILLFVAVYFALVSTARFSSLMAVCSLWMMLLITVSWPIALAKVDVLILNKSQIALIKSISDSEFQFFVREQIKKDGLTIGAIDVALYRYNKHQENKKIMEEKNQKEAERLKLYDSN